MSTEFRFTDEQWRAYQAIPDQGYSHRGWLEHQVNTWLEGHDEGQRIKGIRGLLDYRPLPRDVRRYIEGYLEAASEEARATPTSSGGES